MRFTFFCFLIITAFCCTVYAGRDTTVKNARATVIRPVVINKRDSASIAAENRGQFIADSLAMIFLKPDPAREDQFLTKLLKTDVLSLNALAHLSTKSKGVLRTGQLRKSRDSWVIGVIIGLLIYTALLNLFLSADIRSVMQTFYNKRAVSPLDKEGGMINSWAFIGLFLLFTTSSALVLSQLTVYYHVYYTISGFQLFISLSVLISVLFALKFFVLKFIGFIFDISKHVTQYITILNLTYFNIAFVLLFVAVCLSLLASQFIPYLLSLTLVSIAVIFAWQYLRNSVNIISNFRFHKFYLFIYLCALEICPVLILIKALNI
jgi:hypothetical protein